MFLILLLFVIFCILLAIGMSFVDFYFGIFNKIKKEFFGGSTRRSNPNKSRDATAKYLDKNTQSISEMIFTPAGPPGFMASRRIHAGRTKSGAGLCKWCECENPTIWPFSGCDITCGARCPQPTNERGQKTGRVCCKLIGRPKSAWQKKTPEKSQFVDKNVRSFDLGHTNLRGNTKKFEIISKDNCHKNCGTDPDCNKVDPYDEHPYPAEFNNQNPEINVDCLPGLEENEKLHECYPTPQNKYGEIYSPSIFNNQLIIKKENVDKNKTSGVGWIDDLKMDCKVAHNEVLFNP